MTSASRAHASLRGALIVSAHHLARQRTDFWDAASAPNVYSATRWVSRRRKKLHSLYRCVIDAPNQGPGTYQLPWLLHELARTLPIALSLASASRDRTGHAGAGGFL